MVNNDEIFEYDDDLMKDLIHQLLLEFKFDDLPLEEFLDDYLCLHPIERELKCFSDKKQNEKFNYFVEQLRMDSYTLRDELDKLNNPKELEDFQDFEDYDTGIDEAHIHKLVDSILEIYMNNYKPNSDK